MTDDEPQIGYAAALTELNSILVDLEDDALDIDVLGDKVERASVLIAACRRRIATARLRVEEIVAELDAETTTPPAPADEAE